MDNVGTVGASLATYLACAAYSPDLVISAGTAGGFKVGSLPLLASRVLAPQLLPVCR